MSILYSFRRCPYAIRARMAMLRAGYNCQHREVILSNRPQHMLTISPKGTVPILLLDDGRVIEESLEIMQYVLNWQLTEEEKYWVARNDDEFKFHLDRYKYPNRYSDVNPTHQRDLAKNYLDDLDKLLARDISLGLNDSLFPFVRQFANHDREWFDQQDWLNLHQWLAINLSSIEFAICMKKYSQWHEGDEVTFFPPIG